MPGFIQVYCGRNLEKVSMIGKCYNHRLQTNPQLHEEEIQNTDSHKTTKVKKQALSSIAR